MLVRCSVCLALSSALCEFLLLHDHFRCVYFYAVFVRVASGLDTAGNGNAHSLTEIFLCKLCGTSEHDTWNEIRCRLSVSLESAINGNCISCNCRRILSL